jgi:hypothetical protein
LAARTLQPCRPLLHVPLVVTSRRGHFSKLCCSCCCRKEPETSATAVFHLKLACTCSLNCSPLTHCAVAVVLHVIAGEPPFQLCQARSCALRACDRPDAGAAGSRPFDNRMLAHGFRQCMRWPLRLNECSQSLQQLPSALQHVCSIQHAAAHPTVWPFHSQLAEPPHRVCTQSLRSPPHGGGQDVHHCRRFMSSWRPFSTLPGPGAASALVAESSAGPDDKAGKSESNISATAFHVGTTRSPPAIGHSSPPTPDCALVLLCMCLRHLMAAAGAGRPCGPEA